MPFSGSQHVHHRLAVSHHKSLLLSVNSHAQEGRGNGSGILAWACVLAGEQNFQLLL